jgi:hypothetical protein
MDLQIIRLQIRAVLVPMNIRLERHELIPIVSNTPNNAKRSSCLELQYEHALRPPASLLLLISCQSPFYIMNICCNLCSHLSYRKNLTSTAEGNSGGETGNLLSVLCVDIGEDVVVSLSSVLVFALLLICNASNILEGSPLADQHPWSSSTLPSPMGIPNPHSLSVRIDPFLG